MNSLGIGLEEESKRSLAMEEELERSLHQVTRMQATAAIHFTFGLNFLKASCYKYSLSIVYCPND